MENLKVEFKELIKWIKKRRGDFNKSISFQNFENSTLEKKLEEHEVNILNIEYFYMNNLKKKKNFLVRFPNKLIYFFYYYFFLFSRFYITSDEEYLYYCVYSIRMFNAKYKISVHM